jgi:hypothetical protein
MTDPAPRILAWSDVVLLDDDGNVLQTITAPPLVDPTQVTPAVSDIAALEGTRLYDDALDEQTTFTSDTRPTDVQVAALISQAADEVLAQFPSNVDPSWNEALKSLIALRAAAWIEVSYYKEQAMVAGVLVGRTAQYQTELVALQAQIPPGPTPAFVA